MTGNTNSLTEEARAFDERIADRIAHGHIPDLRRVQPCDWFCNNVWRRPYLVDMVYGRMYRFARKHLPGPPARLLEVGSGPGYMSLEFAREGFDVTGIDLSPACVEISHRMKNENPFRDGFGSLTFICDDFPAWEPGETARFDGICYFQTLHHFADVEAVLAKTRKLLKPGGVLVVNEPSRDRVSRQDAGVLAMLRVLLSAGGNWYQDIPLPQTEPAFDNLVSEILTELREARDADEPGQSVNDNSSFAAEMLAHLTAGFGKIGFEPDYAFVSRLVGGVRDASEERSAALAEFLRMLDSYLIENKVVNPGGFFWAGRRAE